ncbi:MAG: hypothetical protein HKN00_13925 [Flavobacteriaceae bacterium]|nr:hypothetical protein [Bacteroidia bacterium]MBT8288015.1 hypothetical protein [Bacteroidia bacterium]NNF76279.1 hypothetical protein [Flavobacteriaceae bacterium]NNK71578.1 hypothetical protein [Flavobacteriaceae bacterium]
MKTKILNGTEYQQGIFNEIKTKIQEFNKKYNEVPGIAFIACVGHLPLMKYTIPLHENAAKQLGFKVKVETLPHTVDQEVFFALVEKLNMDKEIHAIVLLQPVPKHINALDVIEKINRDKEIEGFHPQNVIDTLIKGVFKTKYPMCLPVSLIELFKHFNVQIKAGQDLVFVADQDFITDPFRSLILRTSSSQVIPEGCAFSIINSDNKKIRDYCKKADFLFVLSEKPEFLSPEWLKPGVCIVDIYSNLVNEIPSKKDPNVLIPIIRGGVNTKSIMNIAGSIAPCPGGLMPVLMAVLLRNACTAFEFSHSIKSDNTKPHEIYA